MICVYDKTATDFTTNGLGPVLPSECTITETLNGTWELTMKHPLDADGKWQRLQRGNIIRAPVPAAMTPAIAVSATPSETKEIWRVSTGGGRLHLRSGTGTKHKIIGKYKNGSQVVLLKKTTSSWYEVTAPDGKRGYMSSSYLRYVRTETTPGTIDAAEIEVVNLKAANITVGTINGQQISPGAVDTSHIATGAVTGSKIDVGAVAANKLNLTSHMIF